MVKKLFFFFSFLFFCGYLFAQNSRKVLHGKIINDSLSVEKVHVINKNTKKGTVTNKYGEFSIPVKVNDTLVFSAVQFNSYRKIIAKRDIQKLQTLIRLQPMINELNEIIIKPVSIAKRLNLPNADKKPLTHLEARFKGHSKASTPLVILGALIGGQGGIDNIYYVLSGKRKKDRKLEKLIQKDKIIDQNRKIIKKLRAHFNDEFFVKIVKIPKKEIDNFMYYCLSDDLILLYKKDRLLEITELFIKNSNSFLNQVQK